MNYVREEFREYWNRRVKYRHPEEKKLRIFARKMFYAGWEIGQFELRKEDKEIEEMGNKQKLKEGK